MKKNHPLWEFCCVAPVRANVCSEDVLDSCSVLLNAVCCCSTHCCVFFHSTGVTWAPRSPVSQTARAAACRLCMKFERCFIYCGQVSGLPSYTILHRPIQLSFPPSFILLLLYFRKGGGESERGKDTQQTASPGIKPRPLCHLYVIPGELLL